MAGSTGAPRRRLVQSVERAIALLEAVADGDPEGETVTDLAATCGLQRATAWRLLATLEAHGLLRSHGEVHRYQLGVSMIRLASSGGLLGVRRHAEEVLRRLSDSTGETADLALPRPAGLTYIAEAAPQRVLTASWLGRTIPLHATSSGKALLAWLEPAEVDGLVGDRLPAYTDTTITTGADLAAELARIRTAGFAVCRGELEPTLNGVSAPILDGRDRPFAVVSIWGPRSRIPETRFPELGALVQAAAAEIGTTESQATASQTTASQATASQAPPGEDPR